MCRLPCQTGKAACSPSAEVSTGRRSAADSMASLLTDVKSESASALAHEPLPPPM